MSAEEYLKDEFKEKPLIDLWSKTEIAKAMESYAREYHAKEMQRKLEEFKNWMERMIEGCDSLGGMEREKSVYQSVLKKIKATTHLKEQKQEKG